MARFNVKSVAGMGDTENLAGGQAFKESTKLELASLVLTNFMGNQYYRTYDQTASRVADLVKANGEFAAKAAVFARNEFGMRSVSHVVAAEVAAQCKGVRWTRPFFYNVVHRVDDMTEIAAFYLAKYGKPLPNCLKDGLAKAFDKFKAYHLAKYRAEGKSVSLVDLVNLVHPKPQPWNEEALKGLVEGTLYSDSTWEAMMTRAGKETSDEEELLKAKGDVWRELIREKKIGYFALLRNLRNIQEDAPDVVDEACEILLDEERIRKSLVLPFRFTTAIDAMMRVTGSQAEKVRNALEAAVDISLANVPEFSGKSLVVLDCSGSMMGKPIEIGSLFAAALYKSNDADLMLFADKARYANYPKDRSSVYSIVRSIRGDVSWGGTNFHSIFETAYPAYDRIIILSDMQGWMGYYTPEKEFKQYKKRTNSDPVIFSFDLQGYGSLQFPEKNVYAIAGFSEKVFDLMKTLEKGTDALIQRIEEVRFSCHAE